MPDTRIFDVGLRPGQYRRKHQAVRACRTKLPGAEFDRA
jgi:hypothetical protein